MIMRSQFHNLRAAMNSSSFIVKGQKNRVEHGIIRLHVPMEGRSGLPDVRPVAHRGAAAGQLLRKRRAI
jgi:hypothetical protein